MDTPETISTPGNKDLITVSSDFLSDQTAQLKDQNTTGIDLGETGEGLFADDNPVLDITAIASSLKV